MDELAPLPPLVVRANTLARQLGFPLTREEALGDDGPLAQSDRDWPAQSERDRPAQSERDREGDGRARLSARPHAAGASASLPGVGRFLAVLAAGCHGGRIGEIGTGVGVGAAWMVGAMPADCTLVTVEIDAHRAAAAAQLLAADRRVRVLNGDASELLPPCGPFNLLFADGGWRDPVGLSGLVDMLRIGGQIVMDDVTPLRALPTGSPLADDDVKRKLFFGDRRLLSTEVVLPDLRNSLLVGTRLA